MKKPKLIDQFNQWSAEWKAERKMVGSRQILKLWQQPLPSGWARKERKEKLGYRKLSNDRGEQIIESQLFSAKFDHFDVNFPDRKPNAQYRVRAIYHNMPLANQWSGQVIADVFGILAIGRSARSLFIKVKTTADDPWFALIENLQQIRLARACASKIRSFAQSNSKLRVESGVWGLILDTEQFTRAVARPASLWHQPET